MIEISKISQHHRWVSTDIILRAEFRQSTGHIATHQHFKQIDNAGAIGKAEH
ncbi:hypothetical protein FQZ97_977800 [compost metagenome]